MEKSPTRRTRGAREEARRGRSTLRKGKKPALADEARRGLRDQSIRRLPARLRLLLRRVHARRGGARRAVGLVPRREMSRRAAGPREALPPQRPPLVDDRRLQSVRGARGRDARAAALARPSAGRRRDHYEVRARFARR